MPAENQDFTIHDLDEFQVRFNVTDAVSTLATATARAWWGVSSTTSPTSTLEIQRSNAAWNDPGGVLSNVDFGTTSVLNIQPTFIDVLVQLREIDSTQGGSISISPTTFPGTFYHECIFSADNDQTDSVGIATGEITVLQSLFTENNYRK
jgi:hypothetical protein